MLKFSGIGHWDKRMAGLTQFGCKRVGAWGGGGGVGGMVADLLKIVPF